MFPFCDSCRRGFESHQPPQEFMNKNAHLGARFCFLGNRQGTFEPCHLGIVAVVVDPLGVGAKEDFSAVAELARAKRRSHACHQHRRRVAVTHVVRAAVAHAQQLKGWSPEAAAESTLIDPRGAVARVEEYFGPSHLGEGALALKRGLRPAVQPHGPSHVSFRAVLVLAPNHCL